MWGPQLELGYSADIAIVVEGIDRVFVERILSRASVDTPPTLPSGFTGVSPGLLIGDQSVLSVAIDREVGVARGRALEIQIALSGIQSPAELFGRPTLSTRLVGALSGSETSAMEVDDLTGWPSSGRVFLGRETIDYSGTASGPPRLTGLTRGVVGLAYEHGASASSGYQQVTDRPLYWRGRFVEVWEHLVAPDDRYVGEQLCAGDYARCVWRGFLDEPPRVHEGRVTLRALPLDRKLSLPLGSAASGRVLPATVGDVAVWDEIVAGIESSEEFIPLSVSLYATPADKIVVTHVATGDSVQLPRDIDTPTSIGTWAGRVCSDAGVYFGGSFAMSWDFGHTAQSWGTSFSGVVFTVPDGYTVRQQAWFLSGRGSGNLITGTASLGVRFSFYFSSIGPGSWVFVRVDHGYAGTPEVWPGVGVGLVEADGKELVAWDAADTSFFGDTGKVAIRLARRGVGGTTPIDIWRSSRAVRITSVAGATGTLAEVVGTLLTSSGTGLRGALDTLPQGYGLGFPEEWIDVAGYPSDAIVIDGFAEPETSLDQIVGGWFALQQRALAQVQTPSGPVMQAVDWAPVTGSVRELEDTDIILGTVQHEPLIASPTRVEIERLLLGEAPALVVQDVPRMSAEGVVTAHFAAGGITEAQGVGWAADTLRLSDGLQAVRLGLRPRFRAQLGEALLVTSTHPAFWSWSAGGPDSLVARVVGVERHLATGAEFVTLLIPGVAEPYAALAPAAEALARPSLKQFRVAGDHASAFAAGMRVRFYIAGDDTVTWQDRQILGTSIVSGELVVSVDADLSTTDFPAGSWMTYQEYNDVTTVQQRHAFWDNSNGTRFL